MSTIEFNINYLTDKIIQPNFKYIVVFTLIFIIVSFILFIICSYLVLKLLKMSIDENNILFYQYNKKSKKILDMYGDYELTKIYLVRQPFSKFITLLLNIFTLYNYEKLIKESEDNFPYHTLILFEIKLPNNMRKLLLLEKNNYINICENFFINNLQDIKPLKLKSKKYTINSILKETQKRLGNEKYFNWHLYKNNCQEFTKELLVTINKYNKTNKEYIFRDKLFRIIFPSEFTLHVGICLFVFYNILEKYIYDNNIFN